MLVQEKTTQAIAILDELGIDAWLTFVRETSAGGDPVLPLIYGPHSLTWQSALLLSRTGERIAIVGRFDAITAEQVGVYTEVIPYDQSLQPHLLAALERLDPQQIVLNYSSNDVYADGLGHGLYQVLLGYLAGTPYADRLVSAEGVIGSLRGRKTPAEVARIRTAVATTLEIYGCAFDFMQPGMTEAQVGAFMHGQMVALGIEETAWDRASCPAVNSGPDSPVGHAGPTDLRLERGHVVHFDFGIRQDDYCSDIQRVAYLLRPGESRVPEPVQRGLDTVLAAVDAAVAAMRPGVTGVEVDAAARRVIVDAGYPEFRYATGHHLGRNAHDGGGVLGPAWERYGDTPFRLLEAGHVYTVEPGLAVPGYGYIGLEEDVLVTEDGTVYLGEPQRELVLR
ncbi:MAG TPA: Xaa-Pro peptidase family protein [Anaerolineae bacterium]|nr:Xaa-Pro peptidase family protein [Anaerolineae bacterium]